MLISMFDGFTRALLPSPANKTVFIPATPLLPNFWRRDTRPSPENARKGHNATATSNQLTTTINAVF